MQMQLSMSKAGLACLIALYAAAVAPIFFVWSFSPDEAWFYWDAQAIAGRFPSQGWLGSYASQPCHLGYGALFWWFYASLIHALPYPTDLWAFRVLVYLLCVSIPVAIWAAGEERPANAWGAVVLWLVTPMAWWTGKLNSPEIPSLALCAWSAVLITRGNRKLVAGWLLYGVAAGLKLTALPALPILACLSLQAMPRGDFRKQARFGLGALLALAAGFLMSNPIALHAPRDFLRGLLAARSPMNFSAPTLQRVLWEPFWEWDAIPSGGIFAHGIGLPACCLLATAIVWAAVRDRRARMLLAAALLTALGAVFFYLRDRFLVWYSFPVLLGIVLLVARLDTRRPVAALLALAVGFQAIQAVPLVAHCYRLKLWHAAALREMTATSALVESQLRRWADVRTVLDLAEVGRRLPPPGQSVRLVPGVRYVREIEAHGLVLGGLSQLDPHATGPVAIAIGDRLVDAVPRYALTAEVQDPGWLGGYTLVEEKRLRGVRLLRFRPLPTSQEGRRRGVDALQGVPRPTPQGETRMIRPCDRADFDAILSIINDAAEAYRGVIPPDRWHEPYMPEGELRQEIERGVRFWGCEEDGELVGVMGIQDVQDVTLIRHAYVRTARRSRGVGGKLLSELRTLTERPVLMGTWAAATWAIRFYEKHGFRLVTPEEKDRLLKKYWSIPDRQVETSVVLGDGRWFSGR